eukprot:PhM_4_TR4450/c0_g1_i1/m.65276/K19400/LZTFL1; leucine zipper transcription factor-like protein 1
MEAAIAKSVAGLSDNSKTVLENYFHWSKSHREQFLKDLDYQYKQYKECRVLDQSYSASDVEDVLQGMFLIIQAALTQEASSEASSFAEYLRNVLLEADKASVKLNVNAGVLDSLTGAQVMEGMESAVTSQAPKGNRLAPLAADDKSKALADSQEEVKRLNEKLRKITEMYSNATQEKTLLLSEAQRLREASAAATGGDAKAQEQLRKLTTEVMELKKEMGTRLSSSTQFLNLKKMLTDKNKLVKDLRERLSKHEKVEDADDEAVVMLN